MSGLKGKVGIRAFLLAHVGEIVTTEEIRTASGNQGQYGRRLRELRDEDGWPIQSHNDAADLKPDEYRLVNWPPSKPPCSSSVALASGSAPKCLNAITPCASFAGPWRVIPTIVRATP